MRALVAATAALAIASFARGAAAQDFGDLPAGAAPAGRDGVGVSRPYWAAGPTRPFVAAVFDVVPIAGRAELDLGYGQPHHSWFGLELSSQMSIRGAQMFAGLRGVQPWGSLRVGGRMQAGASQRLLRADKDVYLGPDLDVDGGPRSSYAALDAELNLEAPTPIGAFGLFTAVHGVFGVDDGYRVFEEQLRVVVEPPLATRTRLTWLYGIGEPETMRLGLSAEAVVVPEREAVVVRAGPAAAVSLTHHLQAIALALFVVASPDEIGLSGADLGQIGLRYRWATGDLWPEFP